jgi:type II secretory pathway component PulL
MEFRLKAERNWTVMNRLMLGFDRSSRRLQLIIKDFLLDVNDNCLEVTLLIASNSEAGRYVPCSRQTDITCLACAVASVNDARDGSRSFSRWPNFRVQINSKVKIEFNIEAGS